MYTASPEENYLDAAMLAILQVRAGSQMQLVWYLITREDSEQFAKCPHFQLHAEEPNLTLCTKMIIIEQNDPKQKMSFTK